MDGFRLTGELGSGGWCVISGESVRSVDVCEVGDSSRRWMAFVKGNQEEADHIYEAGESAAWWWCT